MPEFNKLTQDEIKNIHNTDLQKYSEYKNQGLTLDMSRGKPGADQLDLSAALLDTVNLNTVCKSENGTDCRNYGVPDGLSEAKRLFAEILDASPDEVIISGNSSLNIMYDLMAYLHTHGVPGFNPWGKTERIKFLCPSPGYDRHFAVSEFFGIENIPVRMTSDGPDMDEVCELVKDETVKGIWCVPKYSNPQGITYSDDTVRALAQMETAAGDFKIFWDDAYCVHHLYDKHDRLLPILDECKRAGTPDRAICFASTSKVTFPGGGISAMLCSENNIKWLMKRITIQTIGPDKINQLRHCRMFPDAKAVSEHMKKHAEILRPKFETVLEILDTGLSDAGIARWNAPRGGYFISIDVFPGTAKQVCSLCRESGVSLTPAGATFPGGNDPEDSNIRLAPTFPPLSELKTAMEIFVLACRIAACEKLLG